MGGSKMSRSFFEMSAVRMCRSGRCSEDGREEPLQCLAVCCGDRIRALVYQ